MFVGSIDSILTQFVLSEMQKLAILYTRQIIKTLQKLDEMCFRSKGGGVAHTHTKQNKTQSGNNKKTFFSFQLACKHVGRPNLCLKTCNEVENSWRPFPLKMSRHLLGGEYSECGHTTFGTIVVTGVCVCVISMLMHSRISI